MSLNPFLNPSPTLIQVSTSPTISLSPIAGRTNGNGNGNGTEERERRFEPPPGPPPPASTSSGGNQANGSGSAGRLEVDDLDAEAPPAYTPAADVHQGESTLEVGPRRPFQQVPAQPRQRPPPQPQQQPYLAPQTEWDQYQRHTRQGQWAQSNPSLVSQHSGTAGWTSTSYGGSLTPNSAPNSNANLPPPPPRHPHSQNSTPLNSSSSSSSSRASEPPVSDFARDFYAAGGGDASESQSSNTNRYAPPSGAPPPPRPQTSNSNTNKNKNKASREDIPDDGRPTQVPTPGHPLLLNSKLLVYPVGFECHKCASCSCWSWIEWYC
jgi:hypothetical protein